MNQNQQVAAVKPNSPTPKPVYEKPAVHVVGKLLSLLRGSGFSKGDVPGRPGAVMG